MADVSYPIIHKEECKGCGRCVLGCSQNVIKIGSELNKAGYRYAYYSGEGCSGCRDSACAPRGSFRQICR